MEEEIVFEIGGEGGSITISRIRLTSGDKFIYHHSEFDPTEEGLDVNFREEYDDFETSFDKIDKKYPWPELYILHIHSDFRNYVIERLLLKLKNMDIPDDWLENVKSRIERTLNIKLSYSIKQNGNVIWSIY